jgi:hypothetical protein
LNPISVLDLGVRHAELVPGIHVLPGAKDVDGRDEPGLTVEGSRRLVAAVLN